jgi:hypothetical protein
MRQGCCLKGRSGGGFQALSGRSALPSNEGILILTDSIDVPRIWSITRWTFRGGTIWLPALKSLS